MLVAADACPVGIFLNTDSPLTALLGQVQRLADESGVSAYLVGGPVRDSLLGLPVKDLDISVVGDAPALAARLADAAGGRLTAHQRFGTATVAAEGAVVDLVTARRETYHRPGSLPDVQPGDITDDLARRDFTVNAMAVPLCGDVGQLVDPHGGQDDLRAKVIRVLHQRSFVDDPTRIVRAARYSGRLGFPIADDTLPALNKALPGAMSTVSRDRVRHEMERIFQEDRPLRVLRLAGELGILTSIHPSLSVNHLPEVIHPDHPEAPLVWLAALAWVLRRCEASAFCVGINAPSDWARVIDDTVALRGKVDQLGQPQLSPSVVCALLDGLSPDSLSAACLLSSPTVAERIGRYLSEWRSIAPLLRGTDLLELGVPAGPAVGEALRALRKARLDGETHSVEDEQRLARKWASATD
ncbi:MAG: CCA tRNA nucleotidyltransferase [Chloroflexi bacterium]|nr:CCA tRNA nucleotidyltransferase [Chloroflexota bacterium]